MKLRGLTIATLLMVLTFAGIPAVQADEPVADAPTATEPTATERTATEPTPTVTPTPTPKPPVVKTIVSRRVIGMSVKKRKITAWQLGNPKSKKTVVLFAAIHGNERSSVTILRNLRDGKPIRGVNLWVIPVLNPDGYAKNRRTNAHKVDLNRNFSVGWKKNNHGPTASGKKRFSEPESRALRNFVKRIKPDFVVSFHQPLHAVDIDGARNKKWARKLAKGLRLPKSQLNCGSGCHGTFSMWFNQHYKKDSTVTVEFGRKPSKKYLTKTAPKAILTSFSAKR